MSRIRQSDRAPSGSQTKDRWFTVAEANRALPLVKRVAADVVDTFVRLQKLRDRHDELVEQRQPSAAEDAEHEAAKVVDRLNELLAELGQIGAMVKDFEAGLVDFPGRRNGKDVLLCWRLGEEELTHWHDLTAGFTGRRPIDEAVE